MYCKQTLYCLSPQGSTQHGAQPTLTAKPTRPPSTSQSLPSGLAHSPWELRFRMSFRLLDEKLLKVSCRVCSSPCSCAPCQETKRDRVDCALSHLAAHHCPWAGPLPRPSTASPLPPSLPYGGSHRPQRCPNPRPHRCPSPETLTLGPRHTDGHQQQDVEDQHKQTEVEPGAETLQHKRLGGEHPCKGRGVRTRGDGGRGPESQPHGVSEEQSLRKYSPAGRGQAEKVDSEMKNTLDKINR